MSLAMVKFLSTKKINQASYTDVKQRRFQRLRAAHVIKVAWLLKQSEDIWHLDFDNMCNVSWQNVADQTRGNRNNDSVKLCRKRCSQMSTSVQACLVMCCCRYVMLFCLTSERQRNDETYLSDTLKLTGLVLDRICRLNVSKSMQRKPEKKQT